MGFDLGGAEGGASTGSAGGPWGMVAGGIIGGLLGGKPQLPPELQRLYKLQYGLAGQLRNESNSVPLSMPQEQAALASQRALGAEQFGNQTANLYNAWNQDTAAPGQTADLLQNNANAFQGFQSSVSAEHLLAALNRRQQMKLQASQVAGNAGSGVRDYQQPPDLSGLFGNIARLSARQKSTNSGQGGGGGNWESLTGGGQGGGQPGTTNGGWLPHGVDLDPNKAYDQSEQDYYNRAGDAGAFRFG